MNSAASHSRSSPPPPEAFRLRDAAWHQASIDATLHDWDGRSDLWVFGYGSLVWRPEFDFLEARLARVHGYHRALCLWSRVNRGTPDCPGLVLGLDRGGSCQGKVFRIAGGRVPEIMLALWHREMPTAAYLPRWLNCHTDRGTISGLSFIMNREDAGYAPALPFEQTLAVVRQGQGRYGPCTDYVLQTTDALRAAGIHDRQLHAIARALRDSDAPLA